MRKTVLMFTAVSMALGASTLMAQAKPNFAGKWVQVVDPNAAPPAGRGGGRGGGRGLGPEGTITQDDKTLTITRTTQAGETKAVYNLDGSDSKNSVNMGGNAVDVVSKAKWDGAKLVITTTNNFNGNTSETVQSFSLDGSGQLVIDVTAPGRGGGAPTTTTLTYKKG